jgi:hypothetical protein
MSKEIQTLNILCAALAIATPTIDTLEAAAEEARAIYEQPIGNVDAAVVAPLVEVIEMTITNRCGLVPDMRDRMGAALLALQTTLAGTLDGAIDCLLEHDGTDTYGAALAVVDALAGGLAAVRNLDELLELRIRLGDALDRVTDEVDAWNLLRHTIEQADTNLPTFGPRLDPEETDGTYSWDRGRLLVHVAGCSDPWRVIPRRLVDAAALATELGLDARPGFADRLAEELDAVCEGLEQHTPCPDEDEVVVMHELFKIRWQAIAAGRFDIVVAQFCEAISAHVSPGQLGLFATQVDALFDGLDRADDDRVFDTLDELDDITRAWIERPALGSEMVMGAILDAFNDGLVETWGDLEGQSSELGHQLRLDTGADLFVWYQDEGCEIAEWGWAFRMVTAPTTEHTPEGAPRVVPGEEADGPIETLDTLRGLLGLTTKEGLAVITTKGKS